MVSRNLFMSYMKKIGMERKQCSPPRTNQSWNEAYGNDDSLFIMTHDIPEMLEQIFVHEAEFQIELNKQYVINYSPIHVQNDDLDFLIIPFNGSNVCMIAHDADIVMSGYSKSCKQLKALVPVFKEFGLFPEGVEID